MDVQLVHRSSGQIQLRIALMPDSRFVWVCWNACSLLLWPFLYLWMKRK